MGTEDYFGIFFILAIWFVAGGIALDRRLDRMEERIKDRIDYLCAKIEDLR